MKWILVLQAVMSLVMYCCSSSSAGQWAGDWQRGI